MHGCIAVKIDSTMHQLPSVEIWHNYIAMESRHCVIEDLRCIHIFKDASSIDLFVNNGEEVFSSRVFDDLSDQSISFHTSGSVNLDVKKWDLKRVSK